MKTSLALAALVSFSVLSDEAAAQKRGGGKTEASGGSARGIPKPTIKSPAPNAKVLSGGRPIKVDLAPDPAIDGFACEARKVGSDELVGEGRAVPGSTSCLLELTPEALGAITLLVHGHEKVRSGGEPYGPFSSVPIEVAYAPPSAKSDKKWDGHYAARDTGRGPYFSDVTINNGVLTGTVTMKSDASSPVTYDPVRIKVDADGVIVPQVVTLGAPKRPGRVDAELGKVLAQMKSVTVTGRAGFFNDTQHKVNLTVVGPTVKVDDRDEAYRENQEFWRDDAGIESGPERTCTSRYAECGPKSHRPGCCAPYTCKYQKSTDRMACQ